jgi:hypothetical protein
VGGKDQSEPNCKKGCVSGRVKPRDCGDRTGLLCHPFAVNDVHHANTSRRLSIETLPDFTPSTLKQDLRKQGSKMSDAHSPICEIGLVSLINFIASAKGLKLHRTCSLRRIDSDLGHGREHIWASMSS